MRKLLRRPALAKRYLAVEGQRALAANEDLLPLPVRSLIDLDLATRTDSPAASLAVAGSRNVADPPASFGVIKAAQPAGSAPERRSSRMSAGAHVPRRKSQKELPELDDDAEDSDGTDVMDPFSSPVGGGGAAGKLLQRMLSRVRQLSGGGPPGADTPTHRSHKGIRGAGMVTSTAVSNIDDADDGDGDGEGRKYPEWDVAPQALPARTGAPCTRSNRHRATDIRWRAPDVHRAAAAAGPTRDRAGPRHRQTQGDDIDVDAAVEARVETLAGSAPDEAVYLDSLRRRRDLAVLVLLDVSGSAAEAGTFGRTVHEQQRAAAAALTVALHELGDRVALYAFQSQGRSAVHLLPVKRFDDSLDALVMQRLGSLHARRVLAAGRRDSPRHVGDRWRRRARHDGCSSCCPTGWPTTTDTSASTAPPMRAARWREARRRGIGCLCLTIGAGTDSGELRRVFGSAAHASIPQAPSNWPT